MNTIETTPIPKEAIEFVDHELAKHILVAYLSEIPEFRTLWDKAREIPDRLSQLMHPRLAKHLGGMSPAGREALAVSEGGISGLYDEKARQEALTARQFITDMYQSEDIPRDHGLDADYRGRLKLLVDPLGVPDLADTLMVLDALRWALNSAQYGSGTSRSCQGNHQDGFANGCGRRWLALDDT